MGERFADGAEQVAYLQFLTVGRTSRKNFKDVRLLSELRVTTAWIAGPSRYIDVCTSVHHAETVCMHVRVFTTRTYSIALFYRKHFCF